MHSCERWMDHGRRGKSVINKATTEKTGNSMSSRLRADGREEGGVDGHGALPPVIIRNLNPSHRGGWSWLVVVGGSGGGGFKGHTEHAGNSVPFKVPSERAQLTPGTNKSGGMRPC